MLLQIPDIPNKCNAFTVTLPILPRQKGESVMPDEKKLTRGDLYLAPPSQYAKPPIPPRYPPSLTVYAVIMVVMAVVMFFSGAAAHSMVENLQHTIQKTLGR
jgi:hypothetical protein